MSASDTAQNIEAKAEIARWMLSLLRGWEPTASLVGCEVGVKQGNLANALLTHDVNLTLYGVDRWRAIPGSTYAETGDPAANAPDDVHKTWESEAIVKLQKFGSRSRLHRMESVEAARNVAGGSLHFVYLDADHSYVGRTADLVAWAPKVQKWGYIMGGLWNSAFGGTASERAVTDFLLCTRWQSEVVFGPHKTWAVRKPEDRP